MINKKPVIWILDNHLENQMVFSEMLEENYDLYLFEDAESLRYYRQSSPTIPDLMIVSLATHQHDLAGLMAEGNYSASLAIAPQEVPPLVVERACPYFDEVFAYPYSKTEIRNAIESKCRPLQWPYNILPLKNGAPALRRPTL